MNIDSIFLTCQKPSDKIDRIPLYAALSDGTVTAWNQIEGGITYTGSYLACVPVNGLANVIVNDTNGIVLSFPNLKKIVSALFDGFGSTYSISSLSFPNVTYVDSEGMQQACTKYLQSSIEFPKLYGVSTNAFNECFSECSAITEIKFPKLKYVSSYAFCAAFKNATNLTSVKFPVVTNVDKYAFNKAFQSTKISGDLFPALETINNISCFAYAFSEAVGEEIVFSAVQKFTSAWDHFQYAFNKAQYNKVSFPVLTSITGARAFNYAFTDSTITNIEFPSLTTINSSNAFANAFTGCSCQTITFPSLTTINSSGAFANAFDTQTVYFPALETVKDTTAFEYTASSSNKPTLHFLKALESLDLSDNNGTYTGEYATFVYDL